MTQPFHPELAKRSNTSNSNSNFIIPENISNDNIWPISHLKATPLSFFVDAGFDKRTRNWLWNNGNEISADKWTYYCATHPHQPATDLAISVSYKGIFQQITNNWVCKVPAYDEPNVTSDIRFVTYCIILSHTLCQTPGF